MADRAKGRVDQCRNTTSVHLRAQQLEQELQCVRDDAAAEKKRLEDVLAVERQKVQDVDTLLMSVSAGKTRGS